MGFWKNVWTGTKIALGFAISLHQAKVIKIKEFDRVDVEGTIQKLEDMAKKGK